MSSLPDDFDVKRLKDRNYKGDDFNVRQDLGKGPYGERRCTDVLCCLFFLAFITGMGVATGYGYSKGSPSKLMAPIGGDGNICGVTEGYEDYPYLMIADISNVVADADSIFEYGFCVKKCPESADDTLECKTTAKVPSCDLPAEDRYGASYLFDYCLPVYDTLAPSVQGQWELISAKFSESESGKRLIDLYDARWVIAASLLLSVVFTFMYIKCMDWCAYWLAWFSVVLLGSFFIGGGFLAWFTRKGNMDDSDATNDEYNDHLWWTAIIFWVVALLYLVAIVCLWKALVVSIAIIETAADFFADTKRIVLVPVFYFLVALVVLGIWTGAILCVNSIGEITVESVASQSKDVAHSKETKYMLAYMWFGIFWLIAFLMACNEFVIIVSTCTWYFSRKDVPDDDGIPGDATVMKGFVWAIRYHAGSLAFGSFLLAVVWTIRAIFEYVGNKVEAAAGGNPCTRCLLWCVRCCLACFDRFLRFINMNAYIYMALSNENFCPSALNAFILILKNAGKFAFVNSIGGVFMLIARVCISIATTVVCWFLLGLLDNIHDRFLPMALIFASTYLIASVFISIFDVGANTILQCYLLDVDIMRQSNLEPTHVPPTLARFLGTPDYSKLPQNDPDDERRNLLE